MSVSSFDLKEFRVYKGLDDVEGVGIAQCLECTYPELRHFNLPKPKSLGADSNYALLPYQFPSSAPSPNPTSFHSNVPTMVHSEIPTITYSEVPTVTHSSVPTNNLSSAPSVTLSNIPSIGSKTATDSSSAPSSGPSVEETTEDTTSGKTKVPTDNTEEGNTEGRITTNCALDKDGAFLISGKGGAVQSIIGYQYQLVTQKDNANIKTEVLPVVESSLLTALLPNLFSDECGSSRRAMQERHSNRRLQLVGASSKPADTINEKCQSEKLDEDCFIIDGKMTLMLDDENFDEKSMREKICETMTSNDFIFNHPAINGIRCVDSVGNRLDGGSVDEAGGTNPTFEPVAEQIGTYSYLVSAAAAIVIVLGIYGYRRRHRNKEEKVEVGPLDDSDLANMSNSLSYEGVGPYNGTPAMDFSSINPPSFTTKGGIGAMARGSYFPETIDESTDENDEELAEISLDELNMTINNSCCDTSFYRS